MADLSEREKKIWLGIAIVGAVIMACVIVYRFVKNRYNRNVI